LVCGCDERSARPSPFLLAVSASDSTGGAPLVRSSRLPTLLVLHLDVPHARHALADAVDAARLAHPLDDALHLLDLVAGPASPYRAAQVPVELAL